MMSHLNESAHSEIALEEMLDFRERRMRKQRSLLAEYHQTLICFTLNIAGPHKAFPLAAKTFQEGKRLIAGQIQREGIVTVFYHEVAEKAGYCGSYVVDAPPLQVKRMVLAIEESHPLGRLFDIDVLCGEYEIISREDVGLPARKCLLCDLPAAVCARSRAHSVEALERTTVAIMNRYFDEQFAFEIAAMSTRALLYEVSVTPKPGLVDYANTGAHRDMNQFTFIDSISALTSYFYEFTLKGLRFEGTAGQLFQALRYIGRRAEEAMHVATGNVNTHKGIIFSFGIICAAVGYLQHHGRLSDVDSLLQLCAAMAAESLGELAAIPKKVVSTHGEQVFSQYGLSGIRGEAAGGFLHVKSISLPVLRQLLEAKLSFNDAGAIALLHLIAKVDDTNIVARSNVEQLRMIQRKVQDLLQTVSEPQELLQAASALDQEFIRQNISPGGCADLLAITFLLWFLFPS